MFTISSDWIRTLQGIGGVAFTQFVDALIQTHARIHGVSDSDVQTNLRANLPDGGVDTVVAVAAVGDPTGWLRVPTAWQYKAITSTDLETSQDLLSGEFVKTCIDQGRAYRLAIADSLSASKRSKRNAELSTRCRAIRHDAPEALVVTAEDLVQWANRYPALALHHLHPNLLNSVLHIDAWKASIATTKYVEISERNSVRDLLRRHVDFAVVPATVVHVLWGKAGVGKTRLVYETLEHIQGLRNLVVYARGEEGARDVARRIANDGDTKAVIVADECDLQAQLDLRQTLEGHRKRVRVIAVDNSDERSSGPSPQSFLVEVSSGSLEEILTLNHPQIPKRRRRAYAEMAEGYPRLALYLCESDGDSGADDRLDAPGTLVEYLEYRLSPVKRTALQVLSLLVRVGYQGDRSEELALLCGALNQDPAETMRVLLDLHRRHGFVAKAGRFLYVTPEIVAQVVYRWAWDRWVSPEPHEFFTRFPEALLPSFLSRLRRSGSEEARRQCGEYFLSWASGLASRDLSDAGRAERLAALIETEPTVYLPLLRRLAASATREDLLEISGRSVDGSWGPRRTLVSLLENLAQFRDHFEDCEEVLFRLALRESEPDISNNATGMWVQLFSIYLSGTSVPFAERIERLRRRIEQPDPAIRTITLRALESVFREHFSRMAARAVVAGRVPPDEWAPRTRQELNQCFSQGFAVLRDAMASGEPEFVDSLVELAAKATRILIRHGLIAELRDLFGAIELSDSQRVLLLGSINDFLRYDAAEASASANADLGSVREWRSLVAGEGLHSRILALVGRTRWDLSEEVEERLPALLEALAEELLATAGALQAELEWLFSSDAHGGWGLGRAVGLRDQDGEAIEIILEGSVESSRRDFGCGYLRGLLESNHRHATAVNRWLDENETSAPACVVELSSAAGEVTHALQRALRAFDRDLVSAGFLSERNFIVGRRLLPRDQLVELLRRLVGAAEKGDGVAARVGLDAITLHLRDEQTEKVEPILEDRDVQDLAWRLLELPVAGKSEWGYWWAKVLTQLGRLDPQRGARLATESVIAERCADRDSAESVLSSIAEHHPDQVMEALGHLAIHGEQDWTFYVLDLRGVIGLLPEGTVRKWIERVGVEGARKLARHLPLPQVRDGRSIVPPLTEWVLCAYEEDDRVFREFCAGTDNLRVYSGDIAGQREADAKVASAFLNHPARRVREWAERMRREALHDAKQWRQYEEERHSPS